MPGILRYPQQHAHQAKRARCYSKHTYSYQVYSCRVPHKLQIHIQQHVVCVFARRAESQTAHCHRFSLLPSKSHDLLHVYLNLYWSFQEPKKASILKTTATSRNTFEYTMSANPYVRKAPACRLNDARVHVTSNLQHFEWDGMLHSIKLGVHRVLGQFGWHGMEMGWSLQFLVMGCCTPSNFLYASERIWATFVSATAYVEPDMQCTSPLKLSERPRACLGLL